MSLFSVSNIGLIFFIKNRILSKDFHKDTCMGPVVQRWVSANPGLKFNLLF